LHELARASDVDRMTIRLALRGERAPRRATIARIARACEVPADTIALLFTSARRDRAC
jgi:transcriptional regulator with XRE-family HTH domain